MTPVAVTMVHLLLALTVCASAGLRDQETRTRPSIVLVLTDDQRYDTLSCAGNAVIRTPTLDWLAAEGALFSNACVVTPLCSPSRATILTGKYGHVVGVTQNDPSDGSIFQHTLFPQLLREAGYETAFFGKWHLPAMPEVEANPFDYWVTYPGHGAYFDQQLLSNAELPPEASKGFVTDRLTDLAIDWLNTRTSDRPFFVLLSLKNCHWPYRLPERHRDALKEAPVALPASISQPARTLPRLYRSLREEQDLRWQEDLDLLRRSLRMYLSLVLSIDDNVERLIDALRKRELLDRTALLFTSDNGLLLGEHGFRQKTRVYEESIRVPLLLRYPDVVPPGTRDEHLVTNLDIAPTVLAIAGVTAPVDYQGRSLLALFSGTESWRQATLHYSPLRPETSVLAEFAVRYGEWKYIWLPGDMQGCGDEQVLYHLGNDPEELTDLAEASEHHNALKEGQGHMLRLLREYSLPKTHVTRFEAFVGSM